MAYVVYNNQTTVLLDTRQHNTDRAAKMALTRAVNAGTVAREDYSIVGSQEFYSSIEKQVERKHALTGETFMEAANTPYYCSPRSETYFSM